MDVRAAGRSRLRPASVLVVALLAGVLAAGAPPVAGAPAAKASRPITTFGCPPALTATFTDIDGDVHEEAIVCIAAWGIAGGTTPTTYSPADEVSRAQMASFLFRLLDRMGVPMDTSDQGFTDLGDSTHTDSINGVASVGVARGTTDTTFSPNDPVTRAQMASFIARAIATEVPLPDAPPDEFGDDDGTTHEDNIDALAASGVVQGTSPGFYSPERPVARAAMGSFLARTIDLVVEEGALNPLREPRVSYAGLNGLNEVPDSDEDGMGSAIITGIGIPGTLCVGLYADDLSGPVTAAHIHRGTPAENGPIVVTLPTPTPQPGGFQMAQGCVSGITNAQWLEIQNDPADFYVNFHTEESPDGAVRGQLAVRSGEALAILSGDEVDPGPGDPDLTGSIRITLTGVSSVICQQLVLENADPDPSGHLHHNPSGPGPVFDLTPPGEVDFPVCLSNLNPNLRDELLANPQDFDASVRTPTFPDGAARGQLMPVSRRAARLTDEDEVPGPGDPDANGGARIRIDGPSIVCFEITTMGLGPATAAHIHEGTEGVAGPPVLTLTAPNAGGMSDGCITDVDPLLGSRIATTPEEFYVNVHTTEHPDGALRGQLEPSS